MLLQFLLHAGKGNFFLKVSINVNSEPDLLADVQVDQSILGQLKSPRHSKFPTFVVHRLFTKSNSFKSLPTLHDGLL